MRTFYGSHPLSPKLEVSDDEQNIFDRRTTPLSADMAIYAFLAELSEQSLDALTEEVKFYGKIN